MKTLANVDCFIIILTWGVFFFSYLKYKNKLIIDIFVTGILSGLVSITGDSKMFMIFYLLIFYERIGLFQNQAMILFVVSPKFCISIVFSFNWDLGCVQTDATLLTKNSQHSWMLHVASVSTPCCMLLDVVACCCAKFETGQIFQPTTPNISFVPWSPKRSNIVGATHAHYASFIKTYGLYPSHDAL